MSANYHAVGRHSRAIVPLLCQNSTRSAWFARTAIRTPTIVLWRDAATARTATTSAGDGGSRDPGDKQRRGPFAGMSMRLLLAGGIGAGLGILAYERYYKPRSIDFGVGGGRPDAIPITPEQISARLRENERTQTLARLRIDTATYGANFPSEDRNHELSFRTEDGGRGLAVGVYDGHSGSLCVERLFHELLPAVIGEIASEGAGTAVKGDKALCIQNAINKAFVKLDDNIVHDRIRRAISMPQPDAQALRDYNTAMTGSCATVAVLDVDNREIFYGGTGDARAVIGTRNSETGNWELVPLTKDHNYDNEVERQRIIDEHPGEQVFAKSTGRVLGGLLPTRAFGDAKYKWDDETLANLRRVFIFTINRPGGPENRTPPYVTAKPETGYRKMQPNDAFLIVASDGLWDELTSKQAVSLVGEWIDQRAGRRTGDAGTEDDDGRKPTFVDDNAATHLVRNALGGANEKMLQCLVALQPPLARRYRDDITVTVVFFEPPKA